MADLHPPGSSAVVKVTEASVDRYLKQGWREAGVSTPEPDTQDEAEPDLVCDVCGFEAKTPGGLGSHQRRHED